MKCLCAGTRLAARRLTQLYEESLRPMSLTPAQFELLSDLAALPGRTQAALAESLGLDQTTLSRNVKLLLARGCLERSTSAHDRRQSAYELTRAGHELLRHAVPLWQAAHHSMQQALGKDWEVVWSALTTLNRTLSRSGAGLPWSAPAHPKS